MIIEYFSYRLQTRMPLNSHTLIFSCIHYDYILIKFCEITIEKRHSRAAEWKSFEFTGNHVEIESHLFEKTYHTSHLGVLLEIINSLDILTNGWIIFFTFNHRTTEKKKRKGIPKRISHQGTSCARICFVLFHNFEVFNEPSSAPSSSVLSFYFSSNILCGGKVLQSGRKKTNLSRTAFFGSSLRL